MTIQKPKLAITIAATREGRQGIAVAEWFIKLAAKHDSFAQETIDLKEVALPLFDEPNHPSQKKYVHAHTKAWSEKIAAFDAFVFVVPEYNHGMPPSLLNALDYLFHEWCYKPAAFVSYGGISGGLRSVQAAKPILTALKMMPIPEAVTLPSFQTHIRDGVFDPGNGPEKSITTMLAELSRWTHAMRSLRAG